MGSQEIARGRTSQATLLLVREMPQPQPVRGAAADRSLSRPIDTLERLYFGTVLNFQTILNLKEGPVEVSNLRSRRAIRGIAFETQEGAEREHDERRADEEAGLAQIPCVERRDELRHHDAEGAVDDGKPADQGDEEPPIPRPHIMDIDDGEPAEQRHDAGHVDQPDATKEFFRGGAIAIAVQEDADARHEKHSAEQSGYEF